VTGGSGKLGRELLKTYPEAFHPSRNELDITSPRSTFNYVSILKPDITIHTAALTNVQLCEKDQQLAYNTNVLGTANLINALTEVKPDNYFVLVSTACVFQGDKGNYTEKDVPQPKNYYSFTKKQAEDIVLKSNLKYLIARTNFVAYEPWPYSRAFTDRFGTYLFAQDVAYAIRELVDQGLTGLVHVCGTKRMSMFELAKITTPDIQPMTLKDYNGVAPLTIDMTLRSVRIKPYKLGWSFNANA